jgi:hypothetical protein
MRRSIYAAAGALAFAGAMAVGPFGVAAAAPYVYGCTPASVYDGNDVYVSLSIYNGSASTANLTHKVLAGNGTILNADFPLTPPAPPSTAMPVTSTLPPTRTATFTIASNRGGGAVSIENGTIPDSIRVVSNVPVSASMTLGFATADHWLGFECTPLVP